MVVRRCAWRALWLALGWNAVRAAQIPTAFPAGTKELSISNDGYSGTIPTQLGLLTDLTSFDLGQNTLTGRLPSELGLLESMTAEFVVAFNQLTGPVPTELFQLTKMRKQLNLASNVFSSALPSQMGLLTKFRSTLLVASNQLSGQLATQLGQMTRLKRSLDLTGNMLNGALATELGMLTNMQGLLRVGSNRFTSTIPTELFLLSELTQTLALNSNNLTGPLPTEVGQLSSFQANLYLTSNKLTSLPTQIGLLNIRDYLWVDDNRLSCTLPTELGVINGSMFRKDLNMGTNKLFGRVPTELGKLGALTQDLLMNDNSFTGPHPTELGRLTGMKTTIQTNGNQLTSTVPTEFGQLTRMTFGIFLYINELTGGLPSQFGYLTGLQWNLQVSFNELDGSLPTQIGGMTAFKGWLTIDGNKMHGPIPSEIGRLTALTESLFFNGNRLSQAMPSQIGLLRRMTGQFDLNDNKLSRALPSQLGLMHMRSALHFNNNFLTGPVPSEFGLLTLLESEVVLSNNKLTGVLPSTLGYLTGLNAQLDLSTNQLEGSLPSELGLLLPLQSSLLLQRNNFTQRIPSEFGNLQLLQGAFDLSTNHLTGEIPSQLHQLFQLSTYFELDNNELCGAIPSEVAYLSVRVVGGWSVLDGNDVGTPCCETLSDNTTCVPSAMPTLAPTLLCGVGTYYDTTIHDCTTCPAGKYRNSTSLPAECTTCESGRYRISTTDPNLARQCVDCPEGRISTADFTYCESCTAGQFADAANRTCVDCPAGRYAPSALGDSCYECSSGYFSANGGAVSCDKCSSEYGNAYTSEDGATKCDKCLAGYVRDDSFNSATNGTCLECPDRADCTTAGTVLSSLSIDAGSYRFSSTSTRVYACARSGNCPGGNTTDPYSPCSSSSSGPLCDLCDVGYYASTHECQECGLQANDISGILIVVACVALLAVSVWCWRNDLLNYYMRRQEHLADAFLFITYLVITMQVIVIMVNNHRDVGGKSVGQPYALFVHISNFAAITFVDMPGSCFGPITHLHYVVGVTVGPLGLCCLVYGLVVVFNKDMAAAAESCIIQGMFLVLPCISRVICSSFRCTYFDDEEYSYLAADYHTDCNSAMYDHLQIYAILMCLVYTFGGPLITFLLLFRHRHDLNPSEGRETEIIAYRHVLPTLQCCPVLALALPYKTQYWYWEIFTMVYRLMLTSVALVFQSHQNMILFVLVVALSSTGVQREAQAALNPRLAGFMYMCNWQVVLVLIGLMAKDSQDTNSFSNEALAVAMLCTNVALCAIVVSQCNDVSLRARAVTLRRHLSSNMSQWTSSSASDSGKRRSGTPKKGLHDPSDENERGSEMVDRPSDRSLSSCSIGRMSATTTTSPIFSGPSSNEARMVPQTDMQQHPFSIHTEPTNPRDVEIADLPSSCTDGAFSRPTDL